MPIDLVQEHGEQSSTWLELSLERRKYQCPYALFLHEGLVCGQEQQHFGCHIIQWVC